MAARLPSSRSSAAKTSEKALQPWKRLHPFSPLNRVFKKSAGGGGRGGPGGGGGGYSQYAGDWQVLHPGKKMVGRAFTVQFMPARADLDAVVTAKAREKGIQTLNNQYALDMLQPGDILIVDLMGRKEGGTIVGDN